MNSADRAGDEPGHWGGPDGLALFSAADSDGTRLDWVSGGLCELLAQSRAALSAPGALRAMVFPEDVTLLQVAIDRAIELGTRYECSYRIACGDGVERLVREAGSVRGGRLHAYLIEQTGAVQADGLRVGAEGWYRALVENANDAMLVLEAGRVIDCNAAAAELVGRARHEIVGRTVAELSPVRQFDGQDTAAAGARYIGAALAGTPQRFDWTLEHSSGAHVDVEATLRRAPEAGAGMLVAVVRDVTQRRRNEIALQASERTFRSAFRSAPFLASIVDAAGRYVDVNEAFLETLGLSWESVVGKTVLDDGLLSSAQLAAFGRGLLDDAALRNVERAIVTPHGPKTLTCSTVAVDLDGIPCLVSTAVDITQLKETQRHLRWALDTLEQRLVERNAELEKAIEERSKAMNQLLNAEKLAGLGSVVAGVAHELNTPLGNAVIVATSFLTRALDFRAELAAGTLRRSSLETFVDGATEAATLVEKNVLRAHELIASFKQLAVDQTSTRRRRFDLRELVEEVLLTMRHKLRPHTVIVEIDQGLEMDGFPGPLEQVLTNLIDNALLHGFQSRECGKICIRAVTEASGLRLVFEDDGNGMPPAVSRRAFEPFFTTSLGQGGSGLGLYLVYSIVTALGGGIVLDGGRGGARFEITLPLRAPDHDPAEPMLAQHAKAAVGRSST